MNWMRLLDFPYLCGRLDLLFITKHRKRSLKGTVGQALTVDYLSSLELLELLKPLSPAVIYDVGAFTGTWTLLAKAIFQTAQIHAFEPIGSNCESFRSFTRDLLDVTLYPVGLAKESGVKNMHVLNRLDASSLLEATELAKNTYSLAEISQEHVNMVALDAYAAQQNIPLPDLIKLDIQGYELEAMKGAERCLAHAQALICEVSFRPLYQGQPYFFELIEFLGRRRFHPYALSVDTLLGAPLFQTDILFIKNDFLNDKKNN
jgi:FkbM family methyltransferase